MERLKTDLSTENNSHLVDHVKVRKIETELEDMEDSDIREALDKRRSFDTLTMRSPLKHFKMDTSKGYSKVTRLRLPNNFFNKNLLEHPLTNFKYTSVTNQYLIRCEMQAAFQCIYNKRDLLAT